MLEILSHAVLERRLGSEGRLDKNDDEYTEDSDYENEPEPMDKQASQNIKVGSEHEGEQKLLSVLRIGSSAA